MALSNAAFLVFVAYAIYGLSDATKIHKLSKGSATKDDVGETVNDNSGALGKAEGSPVNGEVKVQDARTVMCPPGYEAVEVYCYKINLQRGDFQQHKNLCFQSGGYLVEISTKDESDALIKYMRSLNLDESDQDYLHIGFVNMNWGTQHPTFYSWMSTYGMPYTNWGFHFPTDRARPCGFVLLNDEFGKWGDEYCHRTRGAICEASPLVKLIFA